MEKSEEKIVSMKRGSSSVDSTRVKKVPRVEGGEGDTCRNWGCSVPVHREYEEKLAELEKKLKHAKEEADFYYWRSEELESRLIQNLLRQLETAQNPPPPLTEDSGENDSATSACSSGGQSGCDKWMCRFCEKNEARVVVQPCDHLCLCSDCSFLTLSSEKDKCPVCGTRITDLFFIQPS